MYLRGEYEKIVDQLEYSVPNWIIRIVYRLSGEMRTSIKDLVINTFTSELKYLDIQAPDMKSGHLMSEAVSDSH